MKTFSRIGAAAIAVGVFALDRWSKWMILAHVGPDSVKTVIPGFFNLVHSENSGVAFGIFNDDSGRYHTLALVALSVIAITILGAMLWKIEKLDRMSAIALSFIFGGAMGNFYDRATVGSVTDFMDFYLGTHHWYIFNVADCGVCVGAGLLLLSMYFTRAQVEAKA